MKVPYPKKWKSTRDQQKKLKNAGLMIEDSLATEAFLRHLPGRIPVGWPIIFDIFI